jgi:hypothetical protein
MSPEAKTRASGPGTEPDREVLRELLSSSQSESLSGRPAQARPGGLGNVGEITGCRADSDAVNLKLACQPEEAVFICLSVTRRH